MQHATPVLAEHRQPPHPVPEPPEHSGAAAGLTDLSRSLATYGPVLRSAGGSAADELPVSSPDDPEEREADQIADRIMRSASDSCDCGGTCGHCGDKPAAVAASDTDGVLHRDGVPGTPASGPVPPTPVSPATDVPKPPDQPSQFPPQDQPKTGEERVKDLQDKLGKGGTKALGQGLSLAADEFSKSWLGKQITDGMEREPVVRFFTKTPVGVVSIVALGVGGLAAGLLTEWSARDPGAPGAAPKDEKITSLQFTWGLGGPTEFQLKTPWIDTPKVPAAKPAAAAPLGEPPELMKVTVRGSGICTPTSDGEVGGPDDAAFIYLWLTRNRNGPEKPLPQLRTPPMGPGIGGTMFKRKPGHTGASDPAAVRRGLSSAGAVLDPADRAFMESRLGTSFGHVRVHSGSEAAAAAASVHANAFTVGHDVVFGGGKYEPGSAAGRRLLAHELTHVVQRRPALQREETKPSLVQGVSFRGVYFSTDAAQLRLTLETLVVERGAEDAESLVYAFIRLDPEERIRLQLRGVDTAVIDQVQRVLEPVLKQLQADRSDYVVQFRENAAAGALAILLKSKEAMMQEQTLYAGEELSGKAPDLDGLRNASKVLAARRRSADAAGALAKATFTKMRLQLQMPAHPGAFVPGPIVPYFPDPVLREDAGRTNAAWFAEEQEYAKLRAQEQKTFPSLAIYADNSDGYAADRLEELPTWGLLADRRMTAKILREIEVRLSNNDIAMRDLEDHDHIWGLNTIIDLTLKATNAKPHQSVWVKHKAAQIAEEKAERKRILMAITIGLGIAAGVLTLGAGAAVGTAGAAVLGAASAAAQVGSTVLTIAAAYEELMEYRSKKAAIDTSLDRANAIANDDPSFIWLAVTLVGAITEVSSLKAAFTSLRETIMAAKAARSVREVADGIAKVPGLPPLLAEAITNRVRAEVEVLAPVVVDPRTLKATAELGSVALAREPKLLEMEFQLAMSSSTRRALQNDVYAEEVILGNGHVWRRQRASGRWCRFSSDPACFIFGEGGGFHIETFPAARKAQQGEWSSTPGNSEFTPNNPIALVRANYRPIRYVKGHPVFAEFAEEQVLIPRDTYNIPDRRIHFKFADEVVAKRRGWLLPNGKPDIKRAKAFRKYSEFTWHHVEGDNVLQLVPSPIHQAAQHAGGFSIPAVIDY